MPPPPNIPLSDEVNIESLKLKVDSITVIKNEKTQSNGVSLKPVVAYTLNGQEYKTSELRVSIPDGYIGTRIKKANEQARDYSTFIICLENGTVYNFMKALHAAFIDYFVANAFKIQTDVFTRFLIKHDNSYSEKFTKKNKSDHASIAELVWKEMDESTRLALTEKLVEEISDTFRFNRQVKGATPLLNPVLG